MSFDIKRHVLDHAKSVIDGMENENGKLFHFNTSIDRAYFIIQGYDNQEKIDSVMRAIQDNLLRKILLVNEKNGIYTNKNGETKQKNRTRKIIFSNLISAYHCQHFDASKSVEPHLHLLFGTKARMGKNFMYLKQALQEEANKYNIKFNFMEDKQETGLSSIKLKYLKRISWLFHQGVEEKIHHFIQNNSDGLKRTLDSLINHYQHTNNLSFFIKTLLIINQRLNELNLDYIYNNINLKETLFFFLSPSHLNRIEVLKQGSTIAINIDNVFDRELLKFAYGFKTEVMDIIVNRFDIPSIKKEQLLIEEKITANSVEKKNSVKFRDLIVMDIRNAISVAKSYEDFRSLLIEMNYKQIAMHTSKTKTITRRKIGINIITQKNSKIYIPFDQLRLSWSKMKTIFSYNKRKNRQYKKLVTNLNIYKKNRNEINVELIKIEYQVPRLLELYCEVALNNDIRIEQFEDYKLERSDMYNIISFINDENSIVVTENRITLKKSSNYEKAVQDILKVVDMKGMNLKNIVFSGQKGLIEKMKIQIVHQAKKNEKILTNLEDDLITTSVKMKY